MAIALPKAPLDAGDFVLRPWKAREGAWYVAARDELIFIWTTEPRDPTIDRVSTVIDENNADPEWVAPLNPSLTLGRHDGITLADGVGARAMRMARLVLIRRSVSAGG
ncbi:MAG TPA: hypothetical protein VMU93_08020 [Caulobacteraceae bacterium]|nr:hypothetical protein [Caulobacteraceae bacterium]